MPEAHQEACVRLGDIGADIAVRLLDPPGHVKPLVRRHRRSALPARPGRGQPRGMPPGNHVEQGDL